MDRKIHEEWDGMVDSADLAKILRERKKANIDSYPRNWAHSRPKSWAEAVRSMLHEPLFQSKHH